MIARCAPVIAEPPSSGVEGGAAVGMVARAAYRGLISRLASSYAPATRLSDRARRRSEPDNLAVSRSAKVPGLASLTRSLSAVRGRPNDPYEASLPAGTFEVWSATDRYLESLGIPAGDHTASQGPMIQYRERQRQVTLVRCWHLNEGESEAMWALYADRGRGLALRSTTRALRAAIPSPHLVTGDVRYLDYDIDSLPQGYAYWPFFAKRRSFRHEQEYRAIIPRDYLIWDERNTPRDPGEPGPEHMPVQLDSLLDGIYVSPTAPVWYVDVIMATVERFGVAVPVVSSQLGRPPDSGRARVEEAIKAGARRWRLSGDRPEEEPTRDSEQE